MTKAKLHKRDVYIVLTIKIHQEGDYFLAECEELGVPSFGQSHEEALEAIREAVRLYVNTLEAEGERERVFAEKGIELIPAEQLSGHTVNVRAHTDECVIPKAFPVRRLAAAVG